MDPLDIAQATARPAVDTPDSERIARELVSDAERRVREPQPSPPTVTIIKRSPNNKAHTAAGAGEDAAPAQREASSHVGFPGKPRRMKQTLSVGRIAFSGDRLARAGIQAPKPLRRTFSHGKVRHAAGPGAVGTASTRPASLSTYTLQALPSFSTVDTSSAGQLPSAAGGVSAWGTGGLGAFASSRVLSDATRQQSVYEAPSTAAGVTSFKSVRAAASWDSPEHTSPEYSPALLGTGHASAAAVADGWSMLTEEQRASHTADSTLCALQQASRSLWLLCVVVWCYVVLRDTTDKPVIGGIASRRPGSKGWFRDAHSRSVRIVDTIGMGLGRHKELATTAPPAAVLDETGARPATAHEHPLQLRGGRGGRGAKATTRRPATSGGHVRRRGRRGGGTDDPSARPVPVFLSTSTGGDSSSMWPVIRSPQVMPGRAAAASNEAPSGWADTAPASDEEHTESVDIWRRPDSPVQSVEATDDVASPPPSSSSYRAAAPANLSVLTTDGQGSASMPTSPSRGVTTGSLLVDAGAHLSKRGETLMSHGQARVRTAEQRWKVLGAVMYCNILYYKQAAEQEYRLLMENRTGPPAGDGSNVVVPALKTVPSADMLASQLAKNHARDTARHDATDTASSSDPEAKREEVRATPCGRCA